MLRKFRHYAKNKDGLAAVEFAFVMPILIMMLLGMVELTQAMLARNDVTNMASTAANLIAEEKTVTGADLTNVFNAVNAMLFPFNLTGQPDPTKPATSLYSITVTSLVANAAGSPIVAWSCSQNGTKETKGNPPSVPLKDNAVIANGTSVIWARIQYTYISPLNYFLKAVNPKPWINDFYLKPRRAPAGVPMDPTNPPSATVCNM